MNFSVVAKTFQGRIIGRNNLECAIEADNDWRSTLQKRYKTLMVTYSNVNSYSKGQYVKYGGYIYRAYRDSTNQTPSFSSWYWEMLMLDAYYFTTSYNSIAIDTASYIYTPIFNTETLRTNPVTCNIKLGIRYSGEDCDMVLFGITTNYSNFTSFGKEMTSTEQSSNSSINGMNSIYGRLDNTKILGATASYIGYTNGSNIAYIDNCCVSTISRSDVYYLSSSGINNINKSTIYYIYDTSVVKKIDSCIIYTLERCLFVGVCQSNTINSIINTQFIGQFSYNNIAGSITDSIFYDTFNYNIIYGTIYGFYTYDYFTRNTLYYFIQNIGSLASPVRIRFLSNIFYNNMNAFTYNSNGVCNFANNTIVGGLSNLTFNNSSSYLVTIQYNTFYVTTNLTFGNGGKTDLLYSTLADFGATTFANNGAVYINGLTTYQQSYSNTFNNVDIRNCRVGSFYSNVFGATSKTVILRDSNISGNINGNNIDRIVLSDIIAGGLSSITVSGGDSVTAIGPVFIAGRLLSATMTAGSKFIQTVVNGDASFTIDNGIVVSTGCVFTALASTRFSHNITTCNFLQKLGAVTTTQALTGITHSGADFTNYSQFEADGTLKMNGTATVFNDWMIAAHSLRAGATPPTWAPWNGTLYAPEFIDAATTDLHGSIELLHEYKQGSDIEIHIHWSPSTINTGNCKWGLDYSIVNIDGTFAAPTTITITPAASGVVRKHSLTSFGTISGTGLTIGAVINFRIYRLGTDAADTFTGSAFLHNVGCHHECDTIGSRTQTAK